MTEYIESAQEPGRVLHMLFRRAAATYQRKDICPDHEGLQVACFKMKARQHSARIGTFPENVRFL